MNAILIITLLIAGIVVVADLTCVALVTVGIHREERRMDLFKHPRTSAEIFARNILGVYIRQPGVFRAFATRSGNPDETPFGTLTSAGASANDAELKNAAVRGWL